MSIEVGTIAASDDLQVVKLMSCDVIGEGADGNGVADQGLIWDEPGQLDTERVHSWSGLEGINWERVSFDFVRVF